jgi:hypothetical protein
MITWLFNKLLLGNPIVAWLFLFLIILTLIAGVYQIFQDLTGFIKWFLYPKK